MCRVFIIDIGADYDYAGRIYTYVSIMQTNNDAAREAQKMARSLKLMAPIFRRSGAFLWVENGNICSSFTKVKRRRKYCYSMYSKRLLKNHLKGSKEF